MVKDLRLASLGRRNEVLLKHFKNIITDFSQLILDLLAVFLDKSDLGFIALGLFFLFNRCDDSPRCTSGTDDVLVGD